MARRKWSWRVFRELVKNTHSQSCRERRACPRTFKERPQGRRRRGISSAAARRAILVAVIATAPAIFFACAEATRYKTLSFFFDGVPAPGASTSAGAASPTSREDAPAALASESVPRRSYPHTPYRENRCEGCHDIAGGGLIRSIKEGLCLTCHTKLLEGLRYVHGPVAVRDCTVCHEYHASPYPNLLVTDPVSTCLNCHDRADLSIESHPAGSDQSCVDCHNPHGGSDRFFVKRTQP